MGLILKARLETILKTPLETVKPFFEPVSPRPRKVSDDDVYAEGVSTWHNIGEQEAEIQHTPSRTRQVQAGADLRIEDVRLKVFDGGWVVQATTVGTSAAGVPVRVPTCLVVTLRKVA